MKKANKIKLDIRFVITECIINEQEYNELDIQSVADIFARANVDQTKVDHLIKWDLSSTVIEYVSHKVLSADISTSILDAINAAIVFEFKTTVEFNLEHEEENPEIFYDLKNGFVLEIENATSNIIFNSTDVEITKI